MVRIARDVLFTVLVLAFGAADVWGQATAEIKGVVADQSGAVLPGVAVWFQVKMVVTC